jgi:hypothetical protein
VTTTI